MTVHADIHHLFTTPIIQIELAGHEDILAVLRHAILEQAESDPGVRRSNRGGWQSHDNLFQWTGRAGHALRLVIEEAANNITMVDGSNGLERQKLAWKMNAWANINGPGNGNDMHCHPGAYWSGCLYVDDGGIAGRGGVGGAIEFYDPRGPLPITYNPLVKMAIKGCISAGLGERIFPRNGLMLLFPSWLLHAVQAYEGDAKRISIAFNLSL
jgi:uncharacterized protein (TIGR02466 family)